MPLNQRLVDVAATVVTPIWSATGTQPAIGNGTLRAAVRRIGPDLHFDLNWSAGTTTTFGTGTWSFALPAPFNIAAVEASTGSVDGLDAGTAFRAGFVHMDIGATVFTIRNDGGASAWGATVPHTWAVGDEIRVSGRIPIG